MKVGLVGFAGLGKTTVFNTLTGLDVPLGFGGEVHLGTVKVPDERIDKLSGIFRPKKTTYAEIVFADIPGEHGADKKGLSRKALVQIGEQERGFAWFCEPSPTRRWKPRPTHSAISKLFILSASSPISPWSSDAWDRAKRDKPDALEAPALVDL